MSASGILKAVGLEVPAQLENLRPFYVYEGFGSPKASLQASTYQTHAADRALASLATLAVEQKNRAEVAQRRYEEAEAELERERAQVKCYDSALREACRKWAACCDSAVVYPPYIRNAGEGWTIVWNEVLS